ncbi:unnamed protein product [Vitrella brassicaformis CCMP3155]|uniref:Uncharacterized protein n=3 Tax=Vitrella brassicaformis TaxID=1169539 RepID=A0A0G4H7Z7_VITBC|nr:unnamed protein product [Vitrella brassicaformis CCMP3155]|eukprot:CEM39807.1 unnamed protein product [Vitrella brassicaformis CCMP3155]
MHIMVSGRSRAVQGPFGATEACRGHFRAMSLTHAPPIPGPFAQPAAVAARPGPLMSQMDPMPVGKHGDIPRFTVGQPGQPTSKNPKKGKGGKDKPHQPAGGAEGGGGGKQPALTKEKEKQDASRKCTTVKGDQCGSTSSEEGSTGSTNDTNTPVSCCDHNAPSHLTQGDFVAIPPGHMATFKRIPGGDPLMSGFDEVGVDWNLRDPGKRGGPPLSLMQVAALHGATQLVDHPHQAAKQPHQAATPMAVVDAGRWEFEGTVPIPPNLPAPSTPNAHQEGAGSTNGGGPPLAAAGVAREHGQKPPGGAGGQRDHGGGGGEQKEGPFDKGKLGTKACVAAAAAAPAAHHSCHTGQCCQQHRPPDKKDPGGTNTQRDTAADEHAAKKQQQQQQQQKQQQPQQKGIVVTVPHPEAWKPLREDLWEVEKACDDFGALATVADVVRMDTEVFDDIVLSVGNKPKLDITATRKDETPACLKGGGEGEEKDDEEEEEEEEEE